RTKSRDGPHRSWQHPSLNAALHAVAADEFRILVADVSEFRDVDSVGSAIVVIVRIVRNLRDQTADRHRVSMVHQIMAEHPGRIRESVRVIPIGAIEQKPSGFNCRSAQHDDLSEHLERLLTNLVDAPHALCQPGVCVQNDVTRNRVRSQRKPSRSLRGRQSRTRAAEVRPGGTSTVAVPAIVTSCAAVVPTSQDRRSADYHVPIFPTTLYGFLQQPLAASHLHRGEEFSVRQIRNAVVSTTHADELFYSIIIRRELRIGDGPVFAVSVTARSLELPIREAIRLATPGDRSSTY